MQLFEGTFLVRQQNENDQFCLLLIAEILNQRNNVDRSIIKNQLVSLVLLCRFAESASTYIWVENISAVSKIGQKENFSSIFSMKPIYY